MNIPFELKVIPQGTTLPPKAPFLPTYPGPGELPSPEGDRYLEIFVSRFEPDFPDSTAPPTTTVPDSSPTGPGVTTQIAKYQFWRRIHSVTVKCGDTSIARKETEKIGVSKTKLTEISAGLEVSVGDIGASLGAKTGTSITITSEKEDEISIPALVAPKCGGKSIVVWQLVWRYEIEITVKGQFSPKTSRYTFEDLRPVYFSDSNEYADETCPGCANKLVNQTVKRATGTKPTVRRSFSVTEPLGETVLRSNNPTATDLRRSDLTRVDRTQRFTKRLDGNSNRMVADEPQPEAGKIFKRTRQ